MKDKVIIQKIPMFFFENMVESMRRFLLRDQVKETCVFENIDVTSWCEVYMFLLKDDASLFEKFSDNFAMYHQRWFLDEIRGVWSYIYHK